MKICFLSVLVLSFGFDHNCQPVCPPPVVVERVVVVPAPAPIVVQQRCLPTCQCSLIRRLLCQCCCVQQPRVVYVPQKSCDEPGAAPKPEE